MGLLKRFFKQVPVEPRPNPRTRERVLARRQEERERVEATLRQNHLGPMPAPDVTKITRQVELALGIPPVLIEERGQRIMIRSRDAAE